MSLPPLTCLGYDRPYDDPLFYDFRPGKHRQSHHTNLQRGQCPDENPGRGWTGKQYCLVAYHPTIVESTNPDSEARHWTMDNYDMQVGHS